MMENSEHVFDLIPAYALGSLDLEDEVVVSNHLSTCQVCFSELQSYQQVVDDLSSTIEVRDPPADLKDRLLRQVRDRGQAPSTARDSWWVRLSSEFKRAPTLAIASLVLVLVFVFSSIFLWVEVRGLRAQTSPTFTSVALEGTDFTPAASGVIIISQDGNYGSLVVDGLPASPPSQQYQLWLIQDGQRTSGGVFSVGEEGYASMRVYSALPLADFSEFGITIEPAGGSEGPTGEKVLGGTS